VYTVGENNLVLMVENSFLGSSKTKYAEEHREIAELKK